MKGGEAHLDLRLSPSYPQAVKQWLRWEVRLHEHKCLQSLLFLTVDDNELMTSHNER